MSRPVLDPVVTDKTISMNSLSQLAELIIES